jgi:hypothetical protein
MNKGLINSIAGLSLLGGGGLLIAPRMTGALFGLPTESPTLLRALGVRDIVIGGMLLTGAHRAGLIARGASDAFDSALIVREAVRGKRSWGGTIVRAAIGATSAVVAITAALSEDERRPDPANSNGEVA